MESLFVLSPASLTLVPVVIALVSLSKKYGVPSKFAPITSIVFAIGGLFLFGALPWQADIAQGLLIGLTASGLFSGTKSITKK